MLNKIVLKRSVFWIIYPIGFLSFLVYSMSAISLVYRLLIIMIIVICILMFGYKKVEIGESGIIIHRPFSFLFRYRFFQFSEIRTVLIQKFSMSASYPTQLIFRFNSHISESIGIQNNKIEDLCKILIKNQVTVKSNHNEEVDEIIDKVRSENKF